MAIQMRRGPLAKYDKNKMLAGEWGISIDNDSDNQKAFISFAPGVSKEVMMVEDAEEQIAVATAEAIDMATEEAEAWAHGNSFHVNDYASGDGSTKSFTLAETPSSIIGVYVDGSSVSAYTLSGKTITFTTAPASGSNNIRVYYTVNTTTDNAKYYKEQAEAVAESIPEDYSELSNDVDQLKNALNSIITYDSILEPYLYKKNIYINNSGEEISVNGYNVYKIPVQPGDVIFVSQNGGNVPFWDSLIDDYVFKIEYENGTYDNITGANAVNGLRSYNLRIAMAYIPENAVYFIVTSNANYVKYVDVSINTPFKGLDADALSKYQGVLTIDDSNSFVSQGYKYGSAFAFLSGDYRTYTLKIKAGDRLVFSELLPNLSYYCAFTALGESAIRVLNNDFTAPLDGMVNIFANINYDPVCTFYPANSIELDYSKIKNPPVIPTPGGDANYYDGLPGVAFGTSLTYRAQTTGGYLQYLPTLSGITFDNQGLGSSTILPSGSLPQMLPVITGYTGYSGKRVCILEGFVNDFYYNGAQLGTWKDTGQTTVCGCVRYALNYILTQNPNLTIFIVMDHFGKGTTAADAVNDANQTQFEFYQEIEKVALSMGVRVIREYEMSEISQLTPQFLLDNIHLNDLGAKQSANAIWGEMKKTFPNEIGT